MVRKTHTLKGISPVQYLIFGIVSSESLLKISMLLNSALNISLKLIEPVSKINKSGIDEFFSRCLSEEEEEINHVFLLKNKENGKLLFQNQQVFDYILAISDENEKDFISKIPSLPKNIKEISLLASIDIKKLKNIELFLS